jgi:hypothetical protein
MCLLVCAEPGRLRRLLYTQMPGQGTRTARTAASRCTGSAPRAHRTLLPLTYQTGRSVNRRLRIPHHPSRSHPLGPITDSTGGVLPGVTDRRDRRGAEIAEDRAAVRRAAEGGSERENPPRTRPFTIQQVLFAAGPPARRRPASRPTGERPRASASSAPPRPLRCIRSGGTLRPRSPHERSSPSAACPCCGAGSCRRLRSSSRKPRLRMSILPSSNPRSPAAASWTPTSSALARTTASATARAQFQSRAQGLRASVCRDRNALGSALSAADGTGCQRPRLFVQGGPEAANDAR